MLREFSKEAGSKKYKDQYLSHTLIVLGSKTILVIKIKRSLKYSVNITLPFKSSWTWILWTQKFT